LTNKDLQKCSFSFSYLSISNKNTLRPIPARDEMKMMARRKRSSEIRQIICKLHLSCGIIARGEYEYEYSRDCECVIILRWNIHCCMSHFR